MEQVSLPVFSLCVQRVWCTFYAGRCVSVCVSVSVQDVRSQGRMIASAFAINYQAAPQTRSNSLPIYMQFKVYGQAFSIKSRPLNYIYLPHGVL